jgi:DNA repair protein RadD
MTLSWLKNTVQAAAVAATMAWSPAGSALTEAIRNEPWTPRPHQTQGVQALIGYNEGRFSVAEVTVAGGKSDMLGMLAAYYAQFGRVIIVAHNENLTRHNAEACKNHGITPGICSSSIATNAFARVTVGTIGTIVNRAHLFKDVIAILVDEVHMVPPAKSSQYRRLFDKIPNAKVHGLTGTPFRADGTGDLAKTFGPIVFRYTFMDGLRDGYLKPIVPVDAGEDETINVEGLATVKGDYDLDEMASRAIILAPSHAKTIAEVMRKFGRRRVLVFCCNIEHVDKMEAQLRALGVNALGVHSQSITGKKDKAVAAFKAWQLDVLVSCNMFTTGFDEKSVDYLAFCRATKSAVYYAQGLGRGARAYPGLFNCLLSDFGGNVARHGSIDAVAAAPGKMLTCDEVRRDFTGCGTEWETWEHGKTCPNCEAIHKSAPKCKSCYERFDPHYHGLRCPHCGANQADLKQCAACEETYAAFLHPICPFCQYDNTITRDGGKDLKTRGDGREAVNVAKLIAAEPWQKIVSPPVKNDAGGWLLTTTYTTAIWPYEDLSEPSHVFLKRSNNGRYLAVGLVDAAGVVHQR